MKGDNTQNAAVARWQTSVELCSQLDSHANSVHEQAPRADPPLDAAIHPPPFHYMFIKLSHVLIMPLNKLTT